jgi:hypothetical protein
MDIDGCAAELNLMRPGRGRRCEVTVPRTLMALREWVNRRHRLG